MTQDIPALIAKARAWTDSRGDQSQPPVALIRRMAHVLGAVAAERDALAQDVFSLGQDETRASDD